ncbi:MAG TPA: hypothetical protein VIL30_27440 [Ramlibacter sp.]|jgi:hypothetical protein
MFKKKNTLRLLDLARGTEASASAYPEHCLLCFPGQKSRDELEPLAHSNKYWVKA